MRTVLTHGRSLYKQNEDGAASSTNEGAEEELRQEIDLLRKEMEQVPLETVKWKTAAENAQRQLDALVDEKGLGKCSKTRMANG